MFSEKLSAGAVRFHEELLIFTDLHHFTALLSSLGLLVYFISLVDSLEYNLFLYFQRNHTWR